MNNLYVEYAKIEDLDLNGEVKQTKFICKFFDNMNQWEDFFETFEEMKNKVNPDNVYDYILEKAEEDIIFDDLLTTIEENKQLFFNDFLFEIK